MLPLKAKQYDYNNFAEQVLADAEKLPMKEFDVVVGVLRNGVISASILATRFHLPMGVLDSPRQLEKPVSMFIPEYLGPLHELRILVAGSICGSGFTLERIQNFLSDNQYNAKTYCTLVDAHSKVKPDFIGLMDEEYFFQPPWEWTAFTPQSHLDRLERGIKGSKEDNYCIGISTSQAYSTLCSTYGVGENFFAWIRIFSEDEIPEGFTFMEAKTTHQALIVAKSDFIKAHGITHFIESDWVQASILSDLCPVSEILYYDGESLHRIRARPFSFAKLAELPL